MNEYKTKYQSVEHLQIIDEVHEYGFYAIDFASFAPGIEDTFELIYMAKIWAARTNLTVAFNFKKKLCVFEEKQQQDEYLSLR